MEVRFAIIFVLGSIGLGIVWIAICFGCQRVNLEPTAGDPRD